MKVLAHFFFLIYVRPFFMSSTSFVYGTFLHHRPYRQRDWKKKKKRKKNIFLFHFYIFRWTFLLLLRFLEPTSFQLSQLDVGPLFGMYLYTHKGQPAKPASHQLYNYPAPSLHIALKRAGHQTFWIELINRCFSFFFIRFTIWYELYMLSPPVNPKHRIRLFRLASLIIVILLWLHTC